MWPHAKSQAEEAQRRNSLGVKRGGVEVGWGNKQTNEESVGTEVRVSRGYTIYYVTPFQIGLTVRADDLNICTAHNLHLNH